MRKNCLLIPVVLFLTGLNAQTPDSLQIDTLRAVEIRSLRLPATRSESVLAVSSLSRDQIRTAQAQLSLAESLNALPGLFTQNDANFSQDLRISIRGFGARAGFGIRGIKVLLDGIPESAPDGQAQVDNLDMATIAGLDVLRGASGGLWGNASGGVLSLRTDEPPSRPGDYIFSARTALGSFGLQQYHLKTGFCHKNTGWIIQLTRQQLEGYRENAGMQASLLNARLRWAIDSSSSLQVLINATDSPYARDAGGLTALQADTAQRSAHPANIRFQAGESLRQGRGAILYEKQFSARHSLRLRTYAAARDFENRLAFENGGQVAFQRFFAGGGGQYDYRALKLPLQLSFGFELDRQSDDRQRYQNLNGNRGEQNLDQTEVFAAAGLYALGRWTPGVFQLSAGLRADALKLSADDHFQDDGDQSGSTRYRRLSPWGGMLYKAGSRLNLYGNATTNFETPTLTELSNNPAGTGGFSKDLSPQRTLSTELGLRIQGRLSTELAVFRARTSDELVPYELANQPGRTYYRNAGTVIRQGMELSVRWLPSAAWDVLASYTYSDFFFKTYTTPAGDVSGNRLPALPRQTAYLEVRRHNKNGIFAQAVARYTGQFTADDNNTVQIDPVIWLKARFGLTKTINRFQLSVFGGIDNITDTRYFNNVRPNAAGGRFFEPAAGRSWLAGIEVEI